MSKPKVAFFDFACCEGCQLTVLACEDELLDILGAIEIVNFREAISRREDNYDIAFIAARFFRKRVLERLLVRPIWKERTGPLWRGASPQPGFAPCDVGPHRKLPMPGPGHDPSPL